MSGRPLVSVVIPVFNLEDYLAETVDSVLEQTCRDFEIILVDDGSTDSSREIMERYSERKPEMLRTVFLAHGGAAAARNAALDMAQGEWVAFLDGDDVWLPGKLAEQLQLAKTDPRCNFIACAAEIYGQKKLFQKIPAEPFDLRVELLRQGCFITLSTALVKRELAAAVRFDETLEGAQDIDFFLRLADSARLGIIRSPLVFYRIRANAIGDLLGGRFLQVHRHFQVASRELGHLQRESPQRIAAYAAELRVAVQRLAHEAAYYALMSPRATVRHRLKLAAIAIAECPGQLKNFRFLPQSLLPSALNRRLARFSHGAGALREDNGEMHRKQNS